MSKSISKGHIIDEYCKNKNGTLVDVNNDVYSCTLNQTDIKTNKNKFYVIQLIEDGSNYTLYTRYGRIGEHGKPGHKIFGSRDAGIKAFEKQFRSKTRNKWSARKDFVKYTNKYFLSDISYEDELKDVCDDDTSTKTVDSKLDTKVQELISMISDINMMKNTLIDMNIDTKKLPLGKIKASQLEKAAKILDNIQKIIVCINTENLKKKPKMNHIDEWMDQIQVLSSKYYTFVPIVCGRRKPPIISDNERLCKYRDTVNDLKNIVITTKIMRTNKAGKNPLDNMYDKMNTDIEYLDKKTKEYKIIAKYVNNTHAPTHSFKLKLHNIYKIKRNIENDPFDEIAEKLGNVQLLIHGSRVSNWYSILTLGMLLDISKLNSSIPIAGKMFSMGLYWANSFSKSCGYVGIPYGGRGKVCLALAEVVLGKPARRLQSDPYITLKSLKKEGCDSTWGVGNSTPSSYTMLNGAKVPQGKLKSSNSGSVLHYDEFIIYNIHRYRFKYLVILDMWY